MARYRESKRSRLGRERDALRALSPAVRLAGQGERLRVAMRRLPSAFARHPEMARTPLLILGGKDDTRVHPSQSLELFRYLKVLGQTPVRLVRYPGEGHGNRKAGGRYDYNLRMMRWLNHYLKGSGGDPPPYELDYGFDQSEEDEEDNANDKDDD